MKGKYTIRIYNNKVSYELVLERNITILTGDSGTGKTSVRRLVHDYEQYGKKSGVTIKCSVSCKTILSDEDWEYKLSRISNSIIFIDEGHSFIKSREFAEAISGSDNYFVLITRNSLPQIPYSVKSILSLRKTVRRYNRVYSKTYPLYDYFENFLDKIKMFDMFVVEDSKAGYQLYASIASNQNVKCISAEGKSNIRFRLLENMDQKVLVIADGAAFGPEMNNISKIMEENKDIIWLFLPECFEWLILKSSVITDKNVKQILKKPSSYIDSKEYISWERFFTDLLVSITANTPLQYNKNELNIAYLKPANIKKIIKAIESI